MASSLENPNLTVNDDSPPKHQLILNSAGGSTDLGVLVCEFQAAVLLNECSCIRICVGGYWEGFVSLLSECFVGFLCVTFTEFEY